MPSYVIPLTLFRAQRRGAWADVNMNRHKMLPVVLLSHIALSIAASTPECDLKKIGITGGTHILTNGANVGSTVEYSCPAGTYPHPSRTSECLSDGQWSNEKVKAQCKAVQCPRPSMFENGKFYPAKARYFVGDVLRFECFHGSQIFGPENRTCQENGKWSGVNTKCDDQEGDCTNPGVPIGATKIGSSYKIGDKVTYGCELGLQMFGSKERVCMKNKRWSGAEPSCRYSNTFDTPKEVLETFPASLSELVELSLLDYSPEMADRKILVQSEGHINIFILIDASKSVGLKNFNTAKAISEVFVNKMSSYEITSRYSIISYASIVRPIVRFFDDDSTDLDAVIEKINKFQYTEHKDEEGTNIRGALYEVHKMLLQESAKDPKKFKERRNVVLLMTEGKHNMGEDAAPELKSIREILDQNWDNFLDVFVFGLGDNISDDEINELASKKDQENHVFKMRSIDDMKVVFDEIIDDAEVLPLCGFSKDPSQDEEGGMEGLFPWIAQITITNPASTQYCKGSIVSSRFILSAAHCFRVDEAVENIKVQVGDQVLRVRNLHRHAEYGITKKKETPEEETFDNDLALIELDTKIVFSRKIRPICLPCTTGALWALNQRGKSVTCSDQEKTLLSSEFVKAMFVSKEKRKALERKDVIIKRGSKRLACIDDLKKVVKSKDSPNVEDLVSNFLCTGGTELQVDPPTCAGDGGGALIVPYKHRYIQVGVISWGTGSSCIAYKRNPEPALFRDFHTDLFKMMDWLKEKLKDELIFLN